MRARLPDESGYVVNSGVRIHYEVHGTGQPAILLLPTWAIVDSRHWKMQVPFLARDYRVITFDPRGNGRSDRPRTPAAYADTVFASDAAAVLDATGTEQAVLAAFCSGFPWALLLAAAQPQRMTGIVTIAPTLPIPPADPWERFGCSFDDVLDTTEGWAKENRHYWRRDWRGYVEFFMSQIATEPHSTKPYDDLVEWGMQTDADTMLCDADAPHQIADEAEAVRLCGTLTCPVLVIGGDQDKIVPPERARRITELTNADLLVRLAQIKTWPVRSKLGDQRAEATRSATRPEKTDGSARSSWGLGLRKQRSHQGLRRYMHPRCCAPSQEQAAGA
jgi:pimeloyl-ACP methyl ester carboxylesterase